jgi:hypothetical protein
MDPSLRDHYIISRYPGIVLKLKIILRRNVWAHDVAQK